MKLLIIGISGTTCSGKTTIAKKLHKSVKNSLLIHQDDYFLLKDDPKHTLVPELNHFNWEIMSSLDMEKMYNDIKMLIEGVSADKIDHDGQKLKLIIIEGFSIYNYKPIADLCNVKYFIEINREVCWNRRKDRIYDPPDVPGYFDKVVWTEYLRHRLEISNDTQLKNAIIFHNGNHSLDELYDEIATSVMTHLSQNTTN